jgi:hypothetical protein
MSKCAELLQSKTEIDFIDVNVGCPIDLVFNKVQNNTIFPHVIRSRHTGRDSKTRRDFLVFES